MSGFGPTWKLADGAYSQNETDGPWTMQIKLSANLLELAVAHHTIFGAKRRAKQIDNSDTKIAITPIAMPVAGLP
jgi:hypothetical protein